MALPTLERTWSFDVNKAATDRADTVWAIKDGLLTCGWTVSSSSGKNGTGTLVADATDNWLSKSDLVFSGEGNAHSWIVIESPSGLQVRINTYSTNQSYVHFQFSPGGTHSTTGLTTLNAPVATDDIYMGNNYGGYYAAKVHVMATTDAMRAIVCRGGQPCGVMGISPVKNAYPPQWTERLYVGFGGGTTSYTVSDQLEIGDGWVIGSKICRIWMKGTDFEVYNVCLMTVEMADGVYLPQLLTVIDPDENGYFFLPMGIFSYSFGANKGRRGDMADMWWGQSIVASGSTFPGDGSKQFVQFGDMIFPWDGSSTPLLT